MPRIIDAHVHLSEDPRDELLPYAALNGLRYDLNELLSQMREAGVQRGLLLSPPLEGGVPLPNERVLEICRRSGGVLSPVLTVEPHHSAVAEAIGTATRNRSEVRGFKVRLGYQNVFPDDPVYDRLYDFAVTEGLPVMFHTGDTAGPTGSLVHSHPLTLDSLANARTDLKIVACHFGNPWLADVGELVYKHPNVYADISGLCVGGSKYAEEYLESTAEGITKAIYFAGGADKVIFGTDYPVSTIPLSLRLVSKLGIDGEDSEKILWRNASRVFGL